MCFTHKINFTVWRFLLHRCIDPKPEEPQFDTGFDIVIANICLVFTLCRTWDIMPLNSPATLWGFYFYFPCERLREFHGIIHWVRGRAQIMVQTPTTSQDCLRPTMPNLNLSEGYMTQAHWTAERPFSCPVAWADYLIMTMMTFPLALLQLISPRNLFPGYWVFLWLHGTLVPNW